MPDKKSSPDKGSKDKIESPEEESKDKIESPEEKLNDELTSSEEPSKDELTHLLLSQIRYKEEPELSEKQKEIDEKAKALRIATGGVSEVEEKEEEDLISDDEWLDRLRGSWVLETYAPVR